jgi:hypothetical protein
VATKELTFPVVTALLASGLYLLVFASGLGFAFLFIPTIPLFCLGLSAKADRLLLSIGIAIALIAIAGGPAIAIVFLLFLGFPAWYLSKCSLMHRLVDGQTEWFSVGTAMLHLTLYGCGFLSIITLYYALSDTNLPTLLAQSVKETFADLPAEFDQVLHLLSGEMSFLILPVTLWLWGIFLYTHAWIANRLLIRKNAHCRPSLALESFTIPSWMLTLLTISALASLAGGESMSFLGKATVISLMFPYFFLGVSVMHQTTAQLPGRKMILFFVYFLIVSQFWPALILSGLGLWRQLKDLLQKAR